MFYLSKLFESRDPMRSFCERLGRPHGGARVLDRVGEWLIGVPRRLAWAGMPYGPGFHAPLLAVNAGPEPPTQEAPTVSSEKMDGSSLKECADPKYRGMHGRPCKFAGGTDARCPKGTVSGWFWKYRTPAGVFYYVDCCGATPGAQPVWCTWADEPNWCLGYTATEGKTIVATSGVLMVTSPITAIAGIVGIVRKAIVGDRGDGRHGLAATKNVTVYGCTLAIPETQLVVAKVNDPKIADHEFFQVMGVDS
jgi:hypothetical protein